MSESSEATTESTLTPWGVAAIAVVVFGLLALVVVVLRGTDTAQDATTVLAVLVPAFASIGAAIFGVQVAYDKGKETGGKEGEATGLARGHKAGQKAAAASLLRMTEGEATGEGYRAKSAQGGADEALQQVRQRLIAIMADEETL
jgi:hypothetical protein